MSKKEMKESCRCSYEGKLEEDPDSQVKTIAKQFNPGEPNWMSWR